LAELAALPGVNSADRHGEAVILVCSDSDQAIRALLERHTAARDIEITGAGLEDAFVRLTGDADDDEIPATGTEVQSAR
jgi:ABC-2 type transport system ATP-binding protein